MHDRRAMDNVRKLLAEGVDDYWAARLTGVPATTIRRWRRGDTAAFGPPPTVVEHPWRPADAFSYAYLLGMYLGDGCVSPVRGSALLRVALDAAYPEVIDECSGATLLVMPSRPAHVYRHRRDRVVHIQSSSRHWLDAFPQHGPGRKHQRKIELEPWQREVVDRFPRQFLRGLIHSDGCRTINRFRTKLPSGRVAQYEYARYFFSNLSPDIRALFCAYCERLGIRWTLSNPRNVSVSHRASVALLDEFVGPKR
jgi:hypothetical protein